MGDKCGVCGQPFNVLHDEDGHICISCLSWAHKYRQVVNFPDDLITRMALRSTIEDITRRAQFMKDRNS